MVKVKWDDKKTDSNIQIVGTSAAVEKTGRIINTQMMPMPSQQGMFLAAIVAGDDQAFYIIPLEQLKIIKETP